MLGGNEQQGLKAEPHVVPGLFLQPASLGLVDGGNHLFPIGPQQVDELLVLPSNEPRIQQQQDDISLFQRADGLLHHQLVHHCLHGATVTVQFEAASIHQVHRIAVDEGRLLDGITGNAGGWVCNGTATMEQPVKKGGLSYVRTAGYHHQGQIAVPLVPAESCLLLHNQFL